MLVKVVITRTISDLLPLRRQCYFPISARVHPKISNELVGGGWGMYTPPSICAGWPWCTSYYRPIPKRRSGLGRQNEYQHRWGIQTRWRKENTVFASD